MIDMPYIDWNEAWRERQQQLNHDHSVDYWDEFAPRFRKPVDEEHPDPYLDTFYEYSDIHPGDSLFDMGCASGTMAIPYAKRGHCVYAADFSQGMLDRLMEEANEEGVADKIRPILLDWNEDWERRDLPQADIAIASRSLFFQELTPSLNKLESVAKRWVCVGAWDKPATHYDRRVAKAIGYERPGYGIYAYILNDLMERDRMPELRFISHAGRHSRYDDPDLLKQRIRDSFTDLTAAQEEALERYLAEHLHHRQEADRDYWQLDGSETSTIAHIRWAPPQTRTF